jgi:hypothetical protein
MAKQMQGHYCKVCGEYKANEKFSGRGHAAHICKRCVAPPLAERNDVMAVNKINGMTFRHLSKTEINWLRKKMHDENEHVRDAAKRAHDIKFPHYERNLLKKGLTARALEFYIHGALLDEYGDDRKSLWSLRLALNKGGEIKQAFYNQTPNEMPALFWEFMEWFESDSDEGIE